MGQKAVTEAGDASGEMMRLAEKLIKSLGVEGALRCCRENHWDGVMEIIIRRFR